MSGAASGAAAGASTGSQILPGWGTLIGAVIGGGIGIGTGMGTKQAKTRLKNTTAEYMNQLAALDMPRYEDLKLSLERYARGEQLTPAQLQALQELDTEVSKITQDKSVKQTQLEALSAMKARAQGGLTLQDKADLMKAQQEIDRQSLGVQKSIISNMQSRGMGGSSMEMQARMMGNQQATQQASNNALNVAANAQNRALAALQESARMGSQINQDQVNFDKMKAQSTDDMRRRNLERQQQAMQFNVSNQNVANQQNFNRANSVSDRNVDTANDEQTRNKNLLMDDYNNQVNRIKGQYGAKIGLAESALNDKKNEQAGWMDMINSVGSMGGGFSGMMSGGGSSTPKASSSGSGLTGNDYDFGADDFESKYGSLYGKK